MSSDPLAARPARLEDLGAIRRLDARYLRVLDEGHCGALIGLFTADDGFVGLGRAREQLLRFFAGSADDGLTAFWHHVTNSGITLGTGRDEDGHARTAEATSLHCQPCVHHGEPHIAAGRYHDSLTRDPQLGLLCQRKQVSFEYFSPLRDGWGAGQFSLPAAAATHRSTNAARER